MQQNPNDPQDFNEENDTEKHEAAKSPAVLDEENSVSGDASNSEPVDIDDALNQVGLAGDDENGPRTLGQDED